MVVRQLHGGRHSAVADPDSIARATREVRAAIELVAQGAAHRVTIVGLVGAEQVAAEGLATAQAARVSFRLVRDGRFPLILVGPSVDV